MEYRKLGRTGLEISALCLGSMTWGMQNSESESHAQMDYAVDRGINFIDTAEMYAVPPSTKTYGRTEEIIGSWLMARKSRSKVILATKVAGSGMPWIRGGSACIDRANILEAVDGSLARLRTDYIDLYQLHWANRDTYHFSDYWTYDPSKNDRARTIDEFSEILETLQSLVRAGKLRHAGLSNESAWGAMQYLRLAEVNGWPRMASIQNEYSLLYRTFEPELAEVAMMEDIGLLAWSPLATGLLSGKYANGARPEGSRWQIKEPTHRDTPSAHAAVEAYRAVAEKHGLDSCQMGLAFVRTRPFTTAVIIGATTMGQLESNIDSASLTLDQAVLEDIDAVRRNFPHPY
jgi:aryl-alcohol dehydrogenase-like predicted oxidoreductase